MEGAVFRIQAVPPPDVFILAMYEPGLCIPGISRFFCSPAPDIMCDTGSAIAGDRKPSPATNQSNGFGKNL
jgi:hypothetical protein